MSTPHATVEQPIPTFSLPASSGQTLSLDSFKGKVPLVLVFIDDVDSASGSQLLDEMNARLSDFGEERSQLLGIVKETARRVREIADDRNLAIPLLADASGATARSFGVSSGEVATVFVVDRKGILQRRFEPFPGSDDSDEAVTSLLYAVRALGSEYLNPTDGAESDDPEDR